MFRFPQISSCSASTVLLLACIVSVPAWAEDWTFEIPDLKRSYLGDAPPMSPLNVSVDLGMEFAEIESASLQLSGTMSVGKYGDLNFPGEFPLSAEVMASFDGPDWKSRVFIDNTLPAEDGVFQLNETFRVGAFAEVPPDYSDWLNGSADFQFTVSTPLLIATTYLIEMPSVTIDSASLVINGQPDLDSFSVGGDFNGDGVVDGTDLVAWESSFGDAALATGTSFLEWQRRIGLSNGFVGSSGSSHAVPEPATAALLLGSLAVLVMNGRVRRP